MNASSMSIAPLEDIAVDIAIQIPDFLDKSGILHSVATIRLFRLFQLFRLTGVGEGSHDGDMERMQPLAKEQLYWQGRALSRLGDVKEAMQAYRSALSQQLLYPLRGEVESALKRLQPMVRKGSRA